MELAVEEKRKGKVTVRPSTAEKASEYELRGY
jgi:hypothetical protein